MYWHDHLVIVRGGGDLGTGVVYRLHRSGFPVVVTELPAPLVIRRTVAVASAVEKGTVEVEGLCARRTDDLASAKAVALAGDVAVLVSPGLPDLGAAVVVDARLAKNALDTSRADAPLVVGLGPGFVAGHDCHAVVETARGTRLGRVLWVGGASPDTGVPGEIGGRGAERVVRAPGPGHVQWLVDFGTRVTQGTVMGYIGPAPVQASLTGVVRGLISESVYCQVRDKIADIDPRLNVLVGEISDKALAVGGGVLEAVMTWISGRR